MVSCNWHKHLLLNQRYLHLRNLVHDTTKETSTCLIWNASFGPHSHKAVEKSTQQTCYSIITYPAVSTWQNMSQQCSFKPGTRPRWFFRWWLTFSSLQEMENPFINTFQYISRPLELSFTTAHSSTIWTLIRPNIYNNSSGHYMQILAQNVLVNWSLPSSSLELGIPKYKCCVQIWIFHSIPSTDYFCKLTLLHPYGSGDWQTLLL